MDLSIDIVIPWVDGSDPEWQKEFKKYNPDPLLCDARFERYRDWGLMQYWFRGIEKFAPWVRKIHFITCGHLPDWLNIENPKLNIVKHEDYIPQEYLPVFSANPIELFMNRIKGLSDKFIYFNDDLFLISPITSQYFFKGEMPCDMAILNAITPTGIFNIRMNDTQIINQYFCKKNVLLSNKLKWFNLKYNTSLFRTIALLPWSKFTGFVDHHYPIAYLKSTLDKVWLLEESKLLETAKARFRSITDINQYLFRYWQFCEGTFNPINLNTHAQYFDISSHNIEQVVDCIVGDKLKIITINDAYDLDFQFCQSKLAAAFDSILPEKSSFEIN